MDAWQETDRIWQQTKDALPLITPDGELDAQLPGPRARPTGEVAVSRGSEASGGAAGGVASPAGDAAREKTPRRPPCVG